MTAEHPEDWDPKVPRDDLEDALEKVDQEASNHNAEYAAGMRHARQLIEEATSR